ncbi:MAG: competence/damage-inducible protein A [Eubacteriaceae bacterium]|jgi:nicotinamide-nucleotide amidase|nr:competence/damage-inducible protein A [Eubacteriaceae bacterium]
MKAVILAVGDEVLLGDVVNSNAAYLSKTLDSAGIEVVYHKTVSDRDGDVKEAFLEAESKADLVVTSGGLGPTLDDLTKKAIADAMGLEMVYDEAIHAHVKKTMGRLHAAMSANNEAQCWMPRGAQPLENRFGTAPGVYLERSGKTVVMLPGPPRELCPMFEEFALPKIREKAEKTFAEKYYMTSGVGESFLEAKLREALLPEDPLYRINTYINSYGVMLKATAFGASEKESIGIISSYDSLVKDVLGDSLYSEEKKELWEVVAESLIGGAITVSSAESYTGGLFSETLCRKEGISSVFKGSIIAYSNEAKEHALGVKKGTIARYGAVSRETALEMAARAAEMFESDVAVSFTGVAGPGPSEGKKAGQCYMGLSFFGQLACEESVFGGDRPAVQSRGVSQAFHALYHSIKELNRGDK